MPKHAVAKGWSIRPSGDGLRYSGYPSGTGQYTPQITVPYARPGPGETLVFGQNRARDVAPSPLTGDQFDYSLYKSYGAGHYNPEYSPLGAYVQACTGGHAHTDFTGGVAFDFTDGTFKLHEHNNGGTRQGGLNADGAYFVSQTSGAPYYEINGCGNTPVPGHPYSNNVYLSSANGGGPKGSYLLLGRCALCEAGDIHSRAVHKFDWSTNVWSRVTDNLASRMAYETGVVYDAARGRFWYCTQGDSNNDKFIPYLRISDWTFNYDETFPNFPPAQVGGGGRAFLRSGKLFLQAGDGSGLIGFDPDSGNDPAYVTISGSAGSSLLTPRNGFVYYPRTGKYYQAPRAGGTTLYRLTAPADPIAGTWTHDTVTVSPGLSVHLSDFGTGGPGTGLPQHYGSLFYVDTIDRLCWVPGGTAYPQLLDPT